MFKKILVFGITLLFFGVNIFSFVSSSKISEIQTATFTETGNNSYIVDDEGDGNFTTIQDAIDNATNGDIIWVYSGNYSGSISINKTISIIGIDEEYITGNDTGNPHIWGGGAYFIHASTVLFSNFSLGGIPDIDKISLEYTNDSIISNCSSDYLLLDNSNGNTIKNCEFNTKFDNFATINLLLSSNNLISDNVCNGGAVQTNYNTGICLQSSDDNQLLNNTCMAEDSINSKGIDQAMYIVSSNGNTIDGNICWQSDIGIKLEGSDNNFVSRNNITMNKNNGMLLLKSNNNHIVQNNFIENPEHASFKKCKGISWSENYWDDLKFSPKLIFGTTGPLFGLIPWLNIDWRPTQVPNSDL